MKKFIKFFIVLAVYISSVTLIIYGLFMTERFNVKIATASAIIMIVLTIKLVTNTGINLGDKKKILMLYKKDFGKYIDNAFQGKLALKKRLENAICLYHLNNYERALKVLDYLYDRCESADDYCGVMMFKGLCYQYNNDILNNIKAYEEMLRYNGTLSDVWLYLSMAYMKNEDYENFLRCNKNCLVYDSQNALAFSNLGSYYLRTGQPEKALHYALRALRQQGSRVYIRR